MTAQKRIKQAVPNRIRFAGFCKGSFCGWPSPHYAGPLRRYRALRAIEGSRRLPRIELRTDHGVDIRSWTASGRRLKVSIQYAGRYAQRFLCFTNEKQVWWNEAHSFVRLPCLTLWSLVTINIVFHVCCPNTAWERKISRPNVDPELLVSKDRLEAIQNCAAAVSPRV